MLDSTVPFGDGDLGRNTPGEAALKVCFIKADMALGWQEAPQRS